MWHLISELPPIEEYQSENVIGYYDNGQMMVVYFDAVNMIWVDAEEGLELLFQTKDAHPEQAKMTHWTELPEPPIV